MGVDPRPAPPPTACRCWPGRKRLDLDAASTLQAGLNTPEPPAKETRAMAKWRDEKQRYKEYKARKAELPAGYQAAVDAVERYAIHFGPGTGETLVPMLEDLIDV